MNSIFPVDTVVAKACVNEDIESFIDVCTVVRCIGLVVGVFKKQNPRGQIPQVECHTFARIVKMIIPELKLCNGYFSGLVYESGKPKLVLMKHSWLKTKNGTIIDPHPCGILSMPMVVIVPKSNEINDAFGYSFYIESGEVLNEFDYRDSWKRACGIVRLFRNPKHNTREIKNFVLEMTFLMKLKPPIR